MARRGFRAGMTEQFLYTAQIQANFDEVGAGADRDDGCGCDAVVWYEEQRKGFPVSPSIERRVNSNVRRRQ